MLDPRVHLTFDFKLTSIEAKLTSCLYKLAYFRDFVSVTKRTDSTYYIVIFQELRKFVFENYTEFCSDICLSIL